MVDIETRLQRMDKRSAQGPWTRAVLEVIGRFPEGSSAELAELLGRDRAPFKADVRKLKRLGLTLSLAVGYRLSPRGCAFLAMSDRG